jgi:hypothetical protein
MTFALSVIAFGRFVIGESWTAREKLGCQARVCDWDSRGFQRAGKEALPAVLLKTLAISMNKAPAAPGWPFCLIELLQSDNSLS